MAVLDSAFRVRGVANLRVVSLTTLISLVSIKLRVNSIYVG